MSIVLLVIPYNENAFAITKANLFHYYLFNDTGPLNSASLQDFSQQNKTGSNFSCMNLPGPFNSGIFFDCGGVPNGGAGSVKFHRIGIIDTAYQFITNGRVEMNGKYSNATQINKFLWNGESWSMNLWFKENSTNMASSMFFSSTPCAGGQTGLLIQVDTNNKLDWCVDGTNEVFNQTSNGFIPSDTTNYHMITFVIDTSPQGISGHPTLSIYMDRVLNYTSKYLGMTYNNINSGPGDTVPALANFVPGPVDHFNGTMDEVSIWRDRALSARDVVDLWNLGSGLCLLNNCAGGGGGGGTSAGNMNITASLITNTLYFNQPLIKVVTPLHFKITDLELFNDTNLIGLHTFSPSINLVSGVVTTIPWKFNYTGFGFQNFQEVALLNSTSQVASNILSYQLGAVPPGRVQANFTNTGVIPIIYNQTNNGNGSTNLQVRYPNTMNLTCTLNFQLENTSKTFKKLTTPPTTFRFNSSSDIINVLCTDFNTKTNATYILTMQNFPFVQQIKDFHAGKFGTTGNFGAIDIVVLSVVIVSMIGFNRINEAVGMFFAIAILGATAVLGIITFPSIVAGAISVVVMLAIMSTRKIGGF